MNVVDPLILDIESDPMVDFVGRTQMTDDHIRITFCTGLSQPGDEQLLSRREATVLAMKLIKAISEMDV